MFGFTGRKGHVGGRLGIAAVRLMGSRHGGEEVLALEEDGDAHGVIGVVGIAVVGRVVEEAVAGADVVEELSELAAKFEIYLAGAAPVVAEHSGKAQTIANRHLQDPVEVRIAAEEEGEGEAPDGGAEEEAISPFGWTVTLGGARLEGATHLAVDVSIRVVDKTGSTVDQE